METVEGNNALRLEAEQSPPLLDLYTEEVGEIKLEIHRVRNRVGIIKGFYLHIRNNTNTDIRRELEDKVNAEVEIISASLSKIADTIERWKTVIEMSSGLQKVQRQEMAKGVKSYLTEVLSEYEKLFNEHRDASLNELQSMLRVTKSESYAEKGSAFIINQAGVNQIFADRHIEIEARYGELLRTDRNLRYLKTKFAQYFSSGDHTDLAVLHLSKLMDMQPAIEVRQRVTNKLLVLIMAFLSSLSLILLMILYFF